MKTAMKPVKKQVAPPKPLPQRGAKRKEAAAPAADERAAKRLSKKNEALADKVASAPDAPRVEARLIVGETSVPVDASSLERTLGAGPWGHGQGLVDAWPDAAWTGLLVHLGLPAFPLDRAVAERPVKRLVQRLWYEAVWGRVPDERAAAFAERDAAGQERYKEEFPRAVEAARDKGERAKESFARGRGGETSYRPTEELKKAAPKGQAATLLAFFKASKWAPATTAQAAEGMTAAGLVTATKPERIAAFYLCDWAKKGWLTRSVEGAK